MTPATYQQALGDLADAHPDIVVMTAENRAHIRGLAQRLGPRFIDVGIAEQTLVGAAAGLAMQGRTPVIHALAPFLTMRAFEFIRTDIGIGRLPVKLVGFIPGLLSDGNGPTHQSLEDVALMRTIPNMQVVCPADGAELLEALPALVESREPCYVRYTAAPPAVVHQTPFAMGRAEVLQDGEAVTLLSYGTLVGEAARASEILESRGLSVRLVNMRTLKPVDEEAIVASAQRTHLVVTIEDHFAVGGLYSVVCEVLTRHLVPCRVMPIAFDERWFVPALLPDVLRAEGLTGPQIADRVFRAVVASDGGEEE
jgi:transketolase